MKKLISVALSLCMTAVLAACGGASSSTPAPAASSGSQAPESSAAASVAPSMTLRFATDSSEDYVSTVQIYKFADEVAEKTDGRIKIEVYAGGQLGEEKACVEQVQMGSLDFTKSSMGALTSFNEQLNLMSLPYLFKSEDHLWAVMDTDIGKNLLASMESTGLKGLCWLDAGSRCFYATKPLNSVEDFKGVKFRVMQSSIYSDTVSCLGAVPISMSGNEVYSALQTGVVDGAENNIPRIIDMSHNELCDYLIVDRHNIMPEMVLVSANVWNKLSAEDQAVIQECADHLQENMIAAWLDTENAALETLAQGGMNIVTPDEATIASFREAMQPVYDKYGAEYADLVTQIENTPC